jgi:sugar phosphate isomerase/epimerase
LHLGFSATFEVAERQRYRLPPAPKNTPMLVRRFLATAWAAVHGPAEPRRLLIALLEQRFAGLGVAPAPRAIDWVALRAAADDLPIEFAAVRAANPLAERSATAGLCSGKDGERQAARQVIHQAVATARQLGCPLVIVDAGVVPVLGDIENEDLGDPNYTWTKDRAGALLARRNVGRNAAVDRLCRELFDLMRTFPDIQFALCQSRSLRAVLDLPALRDAIEDLGHRRVGYWHDAAICARRHQVLGEAQGEWLETFGNRLLGMSLGDASPDGLYLPPGAGGVDYGLLGSYVPRHTSPLPAVLELDVAVAASEMPGMRSCLDKHGL